MKKTKSMVREENKKGLSDVVATVLIILLALAAIAIVWAFVNPSISNTATVTELQSRCFTTELKVNSCAGDVITYELVKGKADGVVGICDSAGDVETTKTTTGIPTSVFGTGTVTIGTPGCDVGDIAKVAAVMISGETEVVCDVALSSQTCA